MEKGHGDCADSYFVTLDDNNVIGDCREFFSLGRELTVPKPTVDSATTEASTIVAKDMPVIFEPEPFTLARALSLQRALIDGFVGDEFQRKLKALYEAHPDGKSVAFQRDMQNLRLTVQAAVLPTYGFTGNLEGIYQMMMAFVP